MNIRAWLRGLGLECYAEAFQENEIDSSVLPKLTTDDLRDLGVSLVGHRRKLLDAIDGLGNSELEVDRPTVGAERRQLTILFCDLVGSTELSTRLDPEDLADVMRAFQDSCKSIIERWDGYIAKYLGDGVLVFFGYPQAHEDDAERAVHSGLALAETIGQQVTSDGTRLAVRVGIATGHVVVGELIGEGAAQEETVVGVTPNLAARLQAFAKPGAVVIPPATHGLLRGLFELDDLGKHQLKGFAAPIQVWQVLGESSSEGRFEAQHGQQLTPLVGRDHELDLLVDRWERAKEGEGQVVLLAGEPGIGKSRIVHALRERLRDQPLLPLSHYCSPYHTNTPLYPIIGQLERAAGFVREDDTESKLDKLEQLLQEIGQDQPGVHAIFAALNRLVLEDRFGPFGEKTRQIAYRNHIVNMRLPLGLARLLRNE